MTAIHDKDDLPYVEIIKEIESLKDKGHTTIPKSDGIASEKEINDIAEEILRSQKVPITNTNRRKVRLAIGLLAQEGATSPRFTQTRTSSEFGITLSVKQLTELTKNRKTTIRRLARGLRTEAILAAKLFEVEGNLSKQYKLDNPTAQLQELIWVSDFQTFSNDSSMPANVRNWLLNNYNQRFNN